MKSYLRAWQALDRLEQLNERAQAGMTTAEYAVGTLAACPQHTSPS